jgi:hypothetical protein
MGNEVEVSTVASSPLDGRSSVCPLAHVQRSSSRPTMLRVEYRKRPGIRPARKNGNPARRLLRCGQASIREEVKWRRERFVSIILLYYQDWVKESLELGRSTGAKAGRT